ncbi:MAG: hypothetical protein HY812_02650 [Planctomycetes bacterium]|nr:hypothetical protein [Planctomycetota bacterium]
MMGMVLRFLRRTRLLWIRALTRSSRGPAAPACGMLYATSLAAATNSARARCWQPLEEVLCRRGERISVEIKERDRRRIGGFAEDLATQRSAERRRRRQDDFFKGLL